jgi:hypothetical protein
MDLGESANVIVRRIREAIEGSPSPQAKAESLIHSIIGVQKKYDNENIARTVAMKVGEESFKVNHQIANVDEFLAICEKYATERVNDPKNAFIYAKPEVTVDTANNVQVVEGIDVKVPVKADGKIKKGGKQILADELYKKYVLEANTPSTNQEFIAIVMKDLDMSKAGATTYAYNCKKKLGVHKNGEVKSKKGRKPKS